MKDKKIKAIFEIFLVISLSFILSLSGAAAVYSQEDDNRVCCQKAMIDGELNYCQYTDAGNCVGGSGFPGKCEEFSACQPVCCDLNDAGYSASYGLGCFQNVPAAVCKNKLNGNIISDPQCKSAPQCQRGCCVVGSQCSLMTEDTCGDYVNNNYPDLGVDFRNDITNELACQNVCRSERRGCCVVEDTKEGNNCELYTFSECDAQGGKFFEGTDCVGVPENKCSKCRYGSSVSKNEWKSGCKYDISDDVYYYDKCGNPIIFGEVKDNCKYSEGFICREDGKGKASCADLNCKSDKLWDNPRVDENGNCKQGVSANDLCWTDDNNFGSGKKFRVNGESWCEFDADAGPGRDLPGTRHYVHSCIEGEEQVFECKDFREEFCFQFDGLEQSAAKCLPNRAIENPCGGCEDRQCCENRDERDCVWIAEKQEVVDSTFSSVKDLRRERQGDNSQTSTPQVDEDKDGICVPLVPPGTKDDPSLCGFSVKDDKNFEFSQSLDVKVGWHNAGWGLDWGCDGPCEAYTQKFAYQYNNICKSQGDCGADYNLAGVWNKDGFSRTCDVDSEISGDYSGGDVNREVDDYSKFSDGHYGEDEADEIAENCLEQLPDPADVTDGEFNFLKNINYGKGLNFELPPDAFGSGLLFGELTGEEAAISISLGLLPLGSAILAIFTTKATFAGLFAFTGVLPGINVALVVAFLVVLAVSIWTSDSSTQTVGLTCGSWNPPTGSKNCHLCNEPGEIEYKLSDGGMSEPVPVDFTAEGKHECTSYLCWSLGQGCEFESSTEEGPKCLSSCDTRNNGGPDIIFNVNQITPLDLSKENILKCREGDSFNSKEKDCKPEKISNGYNLNFVKANTKVIVGIRTDEIATCRWDWERKTGSNEEDVFNSLSKNFDQLAAALNHTVTLDPGLDLLPGDEKTMYIACMDTCENTNYPQYYSVNIKAAKMEDLGAPVFSGINPENGAAVRYDEENASVKLRLNEPAICRWSKTNDLYDTMVNEFNCRTEYNRDGCDFYLSGFEQGANKYYIRCSDETGNKNIDAMPSNDGYTLFRSEPLNISSIRCLHSLGDSCDAIYDKDFTLEVNTIGGGYNGKARCFARRLNDLEFEFKNTDSNLHTQLLGSLAGGEYEYKIRCADDAGNDDSKLVKFNLIVDEEAPKILKITLKDGNLNILTDEDSTCKYSFDSNVIYDEMIDFDNTGGKEHSISTEDKKYMHVKCGDRFNHVTSFDVYLTK